VSEAGNSSLVAEGVRVQFGGVRAIDGVSLTLAENSILGLIGPNGAGKTTLVNVLSGFQAPTAGRVRLGEVDITGWAAHRRARRGLARTFQATRLFGELSVRENVEAAGLGLKLSPRAARTEAADVLEHMNLLEQADVPAASLPYGGERRVAIARALVGRPHFLLLDEPGAGLNEAESDELLENLKTLQRRIGCGVLIIEHDMNLIMRFCQQIHVLDYGKTLAVGTPQEVQENPEVVRAYLGDPLVADAQGH
jgi:branched-chain amino acid transport system ATP-binding protein